MRSLTASLTLLSVCTLASAAVAGGPASAHHGRGTAGVFWFMHISDTHVGASVIEGPNASQHLETALGEAVNVIDPAFAVVTGDICDGSYLDIPASGQDQAEWNTYKSIYQAAGMTSDFYFDLPGNHDGYGNQGMSFYLGNSLQGTTNASLYTSWTVDTPVGQYYFFGLNSAGNGSGPFIENPSFTPDEIAALEAGLTDHADAELSFVFAHHPLGGPANGGQVVDALVTHDVGYYLHGHVHSYSDYLEAGDTIVVNEIDTLGKGNNNNVGVGVIDHNAFVYRATNVTGLWPLVLISAPASVTLRDGDPNPYGYDVCKDRIDNPFRAEVFAYEVPSEVTVEVAGLGPSPMTQVGSSSIWEAELDTTSLTAGHHDVTVSATTAGGTRQETITASFVDGPCGDLPIDEPIGGSGGGGGGGEGGSTSSGVGGSSSGTGGSSGGSGGAGAWGGGDPVDDGMDVQDDGGCGCRQAGTTDSTSRLASLMVAGLALALMRRRRRR